MKFFGSQNRTNFSMSEMSSLGMAAVFLRFGLWKRQVILKDAGLFCSVEYNKIDTIVEANFERPLEIFERLFRFLKTP